MKRSLVATFLITTLGLLLWTGCGQQQTAAPPPATSSPPAADAPDTDPPPAGTEEDFSDSFESGSTEAWKEGSEEENGEDEGNGEAVAEPTPDGDAMTTKTLDDADER